MFDLKPDFEKTKLRMQAFWDREIIDRPLLNFYLARPLEQQVPLPASHHSTSAERWLDAGYQAELALASLANQEFLGDTLPFAYPNLGPEVFSALYGCPLHFGDYGTSWSDPILFDWAEADRLTLDWDHPHLHKLHEISDALLEAGRGKFITGMTDWHSGGDCLAAFRDPQNLALDLLEHRDQVKALLARLETDYFAVYDVFYNKLRAHAQPITSWTPLISDGRYYIPSNDFSIMISKAMFDEVFLPGIARECQFLDHSIYHLDGPGALRHLDSLLAIPELDALQFVPGAGNEVYERWTWVHQKAQQAGKGVQVTCRLDEVTQVMETLDPRGVYLCVAGVPDRETGENLLAALAKWR